METDPHEDHPSEELATEAWRTYLTTGRMMKGMRQLWLGRPFLRPFIRALPEDPRCQICYIPFKGVGGFLSRQLLDIKPSPMNPHLCNYCEKFAERFPGGVELEVTILFADIRNSTRLAEQLGNFEYSHLIRRFYSAATKPLYANNALIEKFIGDGLTAFFVPAFAKPNPAHAAIKAGQALLRATGHTKGQKPWIPLGVGINTGIAYIGSIKLEGGRTDITILGNTVNTAARLCSQAGVGEILISRSAQLAAGVSFEGHELRTLSLKGKQDPVEAWVWKAAPPGTS